MKSQKVLPNQGSPAAKENPKSARQTDLQLISKSAEHMARKEGKTSTPATYTQVRSNANKDQVNRKGDLLNAVAFQKL